MTDMKEKTTPKKPVITNTKSKIDPQAQKKLILMKGSKPVLKGNDRNIDNRTRLNG